jgi:hypothetical protein
MGIQVEFNPDLALRAYGTRGRKEEECLPKKLESGKTHRFLKNGQRNYWLEGEIPLLETKGNQQLSRPLASITILESTHILINKEVYTKGIYRINEVYNINDSSIHFEGMNKIK